MNLIDQYVFEVGQNLPGKVRNDLMAEIRSLIQDTLEGRSQAEGREPDEEMIVEVLKEFGPPAKMAASYLPPRYLIGPRLFPTFMLVVRIVAIVLAVVSLVRLGVDLSTQATTIESGLTIFGKQMAEFMTSALAALGNIVFIFAILEWALPKTALQKNETWDPRTLKARKEPERIHAISLIWGIAVGVLALLIFNVYPQWISMYFFNDGKMTMIPLLTDAFFRLLPVINVQIVLSIFLNVLLLRSGQWDNGTRWFRIALRIISIVVLAAMIAGPSIINMDFSQAGAGLESLRSLQPLAWTGFRMLLGLVLALEVFEIAKGVYQIVSDRSRPVVTQ